MEITLIIICYILALSGILAAIYPIIPGALVSFGSLLLFYFATTDKMTITTIVIWGVVVVTASLLDAFMAPLITKKMGGSKRATRGSLIGVIVGSFFFPPFGMLIGSFAGALLGEWSENSRLDAKSYSVAFGSFLGFILGTGLKLMVSIMILFVLIYSSF